MDRKNYFNFAAFRKCVYDVNISCAARVLYLHLLQLSSAKGCAVGATRNSVEIYEVPTGAMLGFAPTAKREDAVRKAVCRALDELETAGYILRRYQKVKRPGVGLTVELNFEKSFLSKKVDAEVQVETEKVQAFVPLINPSNPVLSTLIPPNPSKPSNPTKLPNPDLSPTNPTKLEQSSTKLDLTGVTEIESEEEFKDKVQWEEVALPF